MEQLEQMPVRETDRGVMLTIDGVVFLNGRAELKPAPATGSLDRVVAYLGGHSDGDVMIEGHTDNLGSEGYNHGLSQRRADSVMTYLIAHGVPAPRLIAVGKGGSSPVAGNNTAAGRLQNARIEVIIQSSPAPRG